MSSTSGHDPLLTAIKVGLANAGSDAGTAVTADHVAEVLHEYGLILPVGVTIGAVWRVRQDPGYRFPTRADADAWARDGGVDGRHGDVEQAWRIQADGVDAVTTWRPVSGG